MSNTIRNILSLLILILAAIYLYLYHEEFTILLSIEAREILIIVLLSFAFFVATGFTFALMVAMVGVRLSGLELLSLTLLTSFFNYLGPLRPGAAIKAVYLKSEKHLSFAQFSAVLAANAFLMLFFTGANGVVLILVLWSTADIFSIELLLLSSLATCAAIIPFIVPISSTNKTGQIWRSIESALQSFVLIKSQKGMILLVLLSILLQFLLAAWMTVFVYAVIGQDIYPFLMGLVVGVFTSLANLFTITPNNLGVQEFLVAYLVSVMGIDFATGLTGAVLARGGHLFLTFTLAPLQGYFMLRNSALSWSSLTGNNREEGPL